MYFKDIDEDVIKFYSVKENQAIQGKLVQKEVTLQEMIERIYSMKIELKSGFAELRLSLKDFF